MQEEEGGEEEDEVEPGRDAPSRGEEGASTAGMGRVQPPLLTLV